MSFNYRNLSFPKPIFLISLLLLSAVPAANAQDSSRWEDMALYGGQINAFAIDPGDGSILYAGSWGGDGLFKSSDSGNTWVTIPTQDPSWFRNYEVFDIAIDPNNPANIWAANRMAVDASTDYGRTWTIRFFGFFSGHYCYSVEVDPHDPTGQTVYVGTGKPNSTDNHGTIFKTTNGGLTWRKVNRRTGHDVLDIRFNPNQPGEVWAVSSPWARAEDEGLIYLSQNSGGSWRQWTDAYKDGASDVLGWLDEVLVHPENPLTVFVCGKKGIARKLDGPDIKTGWNWTEFNEKCISMCILPAEPDTMYAGLDDMVARSTDRGETWDKLFDAPDAFETLVADPFNADVIYAGGVNRGVYKTVDGAKTWQGSNNGIRANSVFSTDFSPDNSSVILAGTIAGVYLSTDNGNWELVEGEDSEAVSFHPEKENIIYAGFGWKIGKSTDRGETWDYLKLPDQEKPNRVYALAVIPGSAGMDTIYAAVTYLSGEKGEILKIVDDRSKKFSEATMDSVFATSVPVNAIAVHPSDSKNVFAGTGSFYAGGSTGALYVSTDEGATWTQTSLQNVVVNAIAIHPSNHEIMYAGCGDSGLDYSGLYKSTDGGTTWENKTDGLPDLNFAVSDVKVDSSDSNIVYAALFNAYTSNLIQLAGVYVTLDGGGYWTQVGLSNYRMYDVNSYIPGTEYTKEVKSNIKTKISFPSSNILAGTASGLYRTKTSGNGVITGYITSQETGEIIDGAIVSSPAGSNGISNEGYYMLMVPAGVHRIRAQASGYIQLSVPTVTVSAGQGVTQDITMTPVTDNGICLASEVLSITSHQKKLPLLRSFRDRVLAKTPLGKHLASLYYTLGDDVWSVLQKNPALKKRCINFLLKSMPVIEASLSGKNPQISSSFLNELSRFLFELEQSSPERLRKELNTMRKVMKSFDFEKKLRQNKKQFLSLQKMQNHSANDHTNDRR